MSTETKIIQGRLGAGDGKPRAFLVPADATSCQDPRGVEISPPNRPAMNSGEVQAWIEGYIKGHEHDCEEEE